MNLDENLARLEKVQLVRRLQDEDPAYIFKHVLTQETAYDSLLQKKRRDIHRLVAEAYELNYAERCVDEFAPLLAQHYAEAGDDEKTLSYAMRAGDLAAGVYAHAEAIAHYSLALDAAQRCGASANTLIRLYTRRGRAYELARNYPQALANYDEMERLGKTRGDRQLELEALMLRATAYAVGGDLIDWPKAQSLSLEALTLAQELNDRAAQARIYWNLLLANRFGNEGPRKAVGYGEKSLLLARELGLKEQLALTLKDINVAYMGAGDYARMGASMEETIALWRELDNKPMLAETLSGAGFMHFARGELQQAVRVGKEAYALNESIGNRFGLVTGAAQLWFAHRELGQLGRALTLAKESIAISEEGWAIGITVGIQGELALTLGELGAFEQAFGHAERARASPFASRPDRVLYPRAVLALLHLQQGDVSEAEELLAGAPPKTFEEYLAPFGAPMPAWTMLVGYAELALAQGNAARAQALIDEVLVSLRQLDVRIAVPPALHFKARVLLAQNRVDEAQALLVEARAEAVDMQALYRLLPILVTMIQIERRRGDLYEANALRAEAREIVEYIAEHLDSAELRQSFLKTPNAREVTREEA